MMLKMIHDRVATGVTRVVRTAAVLRCGKQIEKPPHYYFSWSLFLKTETKSSSRSYSKKEDKEK
jgi:hypothetical protein